MKNVLPIQNFKLWSFNPKKKITPKYQETNHLVNFHVAFGFSNNYSIVSLS